MCSNCNGGNYDQDVEIEGIENDFETFRASEREALKKSLFELWAEKVEKIIGHDLDGDQIADGFSLDFAYDAFLEKLTPEQYAALCGPFEK